MISKLQRKIISYILATAFTIFILIGAFEYFTIRNIIFDNYVALTNLYIEEITHRCSLYFDIIEESSMSFNSNEQLVTQIRDGKKSEYLDNSHSNFKNIIPGFLGISIYSKDGVLISKSRNYYERSLSSRLSSVKGPPNNSINLNYAYIIDDTEINVEFLSFLHYVYDKEDNFCGYVFIDIDTQYLYNLLSNEVNSFGTKLNSYILKKDGDYISNFRQTESGVKLLKDAVINSHVLSKNKQNIIYHNNLYSDISVVSIIPMDEFNKSIFELRLLLITAILLLTFLTFVFAFIFSKSITIPLSKLLNKMKTAETKVKNDA